MRLSLSGLFVFAEEDMSEDISMSLVAKSLEIDFDKMQGLAPAIAQDAATGQVLMLGFMNREACERTLHTGYVTFFSRTRNQLWTKGETSGNRLKLIAATTDCDRDTLLLQVEVEGAGVVCHEGTRSCFTQPLSRADKKKASEKQAGEEKESDNAQRVQS
jgi:phosphoribosyl-ATP pyrophosphohydrolase/phosphoribosyl-AMP cyclohydrolase